MEENKITNETVEATKTADKKFCTSCGAELHPEAVMCPACGAPQAQVTQTEEKELKGFKKFIHRFKTDKKLCAICGGILAVILIVVAISVYTYMTSFGYYVDKMLDEYPFADNATASDGSYLKIDTNPKNKDPDYWTSLESRKSKDSLSGIKWMNEKLGFSSSVYNDMLETNSLMGTQTASNDKYIVTWTYHPNKGLEVKYTKK